MKEGWKMVKLGEVSSFQNGFAFKSTLFKNEGEPIIRISNIQDEKLSTNDLVYFNPKDYKVNFDQYRIFPNDILIAMSGGTTGKLGINQDDRVYYQNQRVGVIREKTDVLCRQYLYYFLQTKTEESLKIAAGAAQPNLSTAQINNFDLPLPPLEEQHRIVSILDASFEKIDALKKNAEENLKNAKALFQQVLAQELKPKEGWVEKKLGEIGEVFSGFAFKSSSFKTEGRYQIIRIGNIKQDNLRLNESPIFVDIVDDKTLSKSLLYKGDLVVTQTGTRHKRDYGFIAMVKNDNLLLNQRNACIRISDVKLAKFVLYYSYTKLYKDDFFANEGGTVGQGNVGISALKEMLISFPTDIEEQHRIVQALDTLSEKCRRLEQIAQQTIRECDALKQSILRQAFSGKL